MLPAPSGGAERVKAGLIDTMFMAILREILPACIVFGSCKGESCRPGSHLSGTTAGRERDSWRRPVPDGAEQ